MAFDEILPYFEGFVSLLSDERRNRLLELVRQSGFASLPDLVKELSVSESTIRRDLAHLEVSGTARRTHGGVFYTGHAPTLSHFEDRDPGNWELKKRSLEERSN